MHPQGRGVCALKIKNPMFSGDPLVAYTTVFNPPWHLTAPLRHRAKKKGTQRER